MKRAFFIALGLALLAHEAAIADTVIATRTIRANAVIDWKDVQAKDGAVVGAMTSVEDVVGLEARVNLYAGRPIKRGDIGPPALVERNEIVPIVFKTNALNIATEGRALARGGVGDRIRVQNLSSRQTVTGTVDPSGAIQVGQ